MYFKNERYSLHHRDFLQNFSSFKRWLRSAYTLNAIYSDSQPGDILINELKDKLTPTEFKTLLESIIQDINQERCN